MPLRQLGLRHLNCGEAGVAAHAPLTPELRGPSPGGHLSPSQRAPGLCPASSPPSVEGGRGSCRKVVLRPWG